MSRAYIGAGGWSYFKVPGINPLSAYSKAFDFVEVNSTFYSNPSLTTVRSWRRRVPHDFMFSVRCHKDLTHKYYLSPVKENTEILERSLVFCDELRAEILHIQTPPSFNPDEKIKDIKDLFLSFDPGGVKLAWEIRGKMGKRTIEFMRDFGIIHCTDISREMPALESDILYTRLFGHGMHNLYQFDDDELLNIDSKTKDNMKKDAYITFHGSRMYKDAARLKVYKRSGIFPSVTDSMGLASLRSVIEEDAVFPLTRSKLIEKHGWKVFDLTSHKHLHASFLLEKLPDREYFDIEDTMDELDHIFVE